MNDKGKLINEKDVEELALNLHKKKVRHSQEIYQSPHILSSK